MNIEFIRTKLRVYAFRIPEIRSIFSSVVPETLFLKKINISVYSDIKKTFISSNKQDFKRKKQT